MKATKWLALFAVLALVLAACSPSDEGGSDTTEATGGTEAPDTTEGGGDEGTDTTEGGSDGAMAGQGGELLILQWQAPSQANGLLSSGTKDILAASLVNEPLAKAAPDGSLVPALAAEIPTLDNGGVAEDFSSITWTLRDDVSWSDGTPFTSDDVLFTWEYCSDELTGCSADFSVVDTVEAIDDYTIKVNFIDPQPYPYGNFTTYTSPIIQREQFQDCVGEQASACTEQNFAPIGTGPYMITELRPEDTVSYEYNPNYRGAAEGQPFFGTVTIKGGGDAEASARSVLEIGEADYAWNLQVAPEILLPMEAAGNGTIVTSFTANVEHINLNQTDPRGDPPSEHPSQHPVLYQNGEFARALSLAIDRESIVAVGYGPTGTPICTLWPVGDQKTDANDWCLTRDVATANQILDDLGYVDTNGDGTREAEGFGELVFDYVTSTNAVRQSTQDIIKSNWEEIGIGVNMSNQDASLFFDGTSASDFSIWKFFSDMEMFTNGATLPDAAGYLDGWHTREIPTAALGWPASDNMPRLSLQEYDDAADRALTLAPSDAEYNELVKSMQQLMVDAGAVIPLVHRGNVSGISNTIQGFGDPNGWDSEYWNIHEWTRS